MMGEVRFEDLERDPIGQMRGSLQEAAPSLANNFTSMQVVPQYRG
jgi:hypothetical protein